MRGLLRTELIELQPWKKLTEECIRKVQVYTAIYASINRGFRDGEMFIGICQSNLLERSVPFELNKTEEPW